jgi:hypothetical protein
MSKEGEKESAGRGKRELHLISDIQQAAAAAVVEIKLYYKVKHENVISFSLAPHPCSPALGFSLSRSMAR